MSASPDYLSALLKAGTGAYGTYQGTQRGGASGLAGALGSASRGAAGVGSLVSPAYTGALGQASNTLGGAGNALGVVGGVQQGGVGGYGSAALNTGQLAGRTGALGQANSGLNKGVGDLSNALSIYQGIQQGGVGGYGGAAVNAAQLAGRSGALGAASAPIASAAGYLAAPLSVYNFAKNWQSGNAGSDALNGASTGAAIGSIVPGIGTAIGALGGALVGGLSSLVGPGRVDPETANWQNYLNTYTGSAKTPTQQADLASQVSNPYGLLAGEFDEKSSTLPMYQKYGRMGEQKFTNDLTKQIQSGIDSGTITKNDSASDIYSKVVDPWVSSMGKGWNNVGDAYKGATRGLLTQMVSQYMGGQAPADWKAVGGDNPFAKLSGPVFQTTPGPTNPGPIAASTNVQPAQVTNPGGWAIAGASPTARAKGGSMKDKKRSRKLRRVYDGSFASRKGFDDGGSAYSNYASQPSFNPGSALDFNSLAAGNSGNSNTDLSNYLGGDLAGQIGGDSATTSSLGDWLTSFDKQYGLNGQAATPAGSSKPTWTQNATGAAGLSGLLKAYAPLVPLVGAIASKPSSASKAPTPVGGMTSGARTMPAASFNRAPVASPTNRADGAPMTQQDWYTYGQRPEASFFSNNSVPLVGASTGVPTNTGIQPMVGSNLAKGGALGAAGVASMLSPGQEEFDSSAEQHVRGPGDGTSDDIPAKLSDGEYVMDANTVSMLGNGSNDAGARRLDQLRTNLRKHAAKPMAKGKQFMKAKPPESYMKGKGK